jgi:hypothetical protein
MADYAHLHPSVAALTTQLASSGYARIVGSVTARPSERLPRLRIC